MWCKTGMKVVFFFLLIEKMSILKGKYCKCEKERPDLLCFFVLLLGVLHPSHSPMCLLFRVMYSVLVSFSGPSKCTDCQNHKIMYSGFMLRAAVHQGLNRLKLSTWTYTNGLKLKGKWNFSCAVEHFKCVSIKSMMFSKKELFPVK